MPVQIVMNAKNILLSSKLNFFFLGGGGGLQIEGSIDQLQYFSVENSEGLFGCKYVFQNKKN
jgi:hypothetical protein